MGSSIPCLKDSYAGVSEIDLVADGNELVALNVLSSRDNNGLTKILSGAERGLHAERPARVTFDSQQGLIGYPDATFFSTVQANQASLVASIGSVVPGGLLARPKITAPNGRNVAYTVHVDVSFGVLYGPDAWPQVNFYQIDASGQEVLQTVLMAAGGASVFNSSAIQNMATSLTWSGVVPADGDHHWGGVLRVSPSTVHGTSSPPKFINGFIRASYFAVESL